jgi:hypothetical protein
MVALCLAMALGTEAAQANPAGARSGLTAVGGQGTGSVKLSPTAQDQGTFHVQGEVNVHGALPNISFSVQRAIDLSPGDGVCTIAPSPPQGWITLTTLTTSDGGAGAAHFERATTLPSGTRFDLIFRVVSDDGTQLLMSECVTVTVK